ncbi:MAG: tetratricopeptide repeat protein, partial [Bacteroidia bacterium]
MRLLVLAFALGCALTGHAQLDVVDSKTAANHFQVGNYEEALDAYLSLLEEHPKNMEYNYRIAVCYLNTNIAKTKSIPYLELVTRQPKHEPDALYLLGRAYHFAYRFDDALRCYNQFKQNGKGTAINLADVDREIQNCYNARELMKYPLNVSFQPLGNAINSQYPDYYPFVPGDESFLVFTTKRPDGGALRQKDGSYFSSVWLSRVKDGGYQKAQNIGAPVANADGNVEIIGLSGNGKYMILYYENPDMSKAGDLYLAAYDDAKGNYRTPEKVDATISSSRNYEIAASISNDGNTLYFASDRPGG